MTARGLAELSPGARRALLASLLRRVAEGDAPQTAAFGAVPVSAVQRRLWFFDQLEPDTWFYNVPVTLALDGPLDVRALERSLAEIVRRHDTLRTTIVARLDEPRQVVAPVASFALPVVDLSGFSERENPNS